MELLEQCELTEEARKRHKNGLGREETESSPTQRLLATEYKDRDTGTGTTKTTVNVEEDSEKEEEGKEKTKKNAFQDEEEGIANGQRLFSSAGLGVKRPNFA